LGGLGGQPPDLGSHEAIDPKFGIAERSWKPMRCFYTNS
jgi:hypothetical protein